MTDLKVEYIEIEKLKKYKDNPRVNENAIEPVVKSIKEFGFNNPILVDKDYRICAGHTRLEAAKRLELKKVPVVVLDITETQFKAYNIADNKTSEFGTWEEETLAKTLKHLQGEDINALEATSIEGEQLERLLQSLDGDKEIKASAINIIKISLRFKSDKTFREIIPKVEKILLDYEDVELNLGKNAKLLNKTSTDKSTENVQ